MLLIGVGCWRWPSPDDRAGGLTLVFLAYAVAHGFEQFDRAIFDLGGVSGPRAQASGGRAAIALGLRMRARRAAGERTKAPRDRGARQVCEMTSSGAGCRRG
jgi:hypothetical protein